MLFVYPAIFHKEEDAYWVEFPDLEGCHTYGSSIEDTTSLVSCDINQYKVTKAVKKTLTIPAWLNDRAVSMGLNFSKILQEALIAEISGYDRLSTR